MPKFHIPAALLPMVLLAGCSRPLEPVAATDEPSLGVPAQAEVAPLGGGSAPRLFYPLDLGNRWRYHRVFTVRPEPANPTLPTTVTRSAIERETWCEEVPPACLGASVPEARAPSADRALETSLAAAIMAGGADGARATEAARRVTARLDAVRLVIQGGASGVQAGEITRLDYPLAVASTWVVREQPYLIRSTVEAIETLDLEVGRARAYRITLEAPSVMGPQDRIWLWYSRSGMLHQVVHIEIPTDLGLLVGDETIRLEELSVARGRF